ncbi:MAG TPA: TolC family protein, partial [Ramlibacter sp.]|nr:TolC family protein [Ramlibacter sp.]
SNSSSDSVTSISSRHENKSIGVQLSVPIYSGGAVSSQTRQAVAELERTEQGLESTRRELGLRVEKEYRAITEGVLRIRALEQAVRSAETVVISNRRSFEGGSRTLVDVLNAEEQRFVALRDLAQARYMYLLARVRIQALAGLADTATIDEINASLKP